MFGFAISQSDLEFILKILSLMAGFTVSCLAGYSIWLTVERKKMENKEIRMKKRFMQFMANATNSEEEPTTTT